MRLHWSLLSRVGGAGRERRRRERQRKTKPRDYIGSDSVYLKVRADSSLKSRTHQTHDPFLFPTQRHVRSEALPSCFSLPRLRKWRKKKTSRKKGRHTPKSNSDFYQIPQLCQMGSYRHLQLQAFFTAVFTIIITSSMHKRCASGEPQSNPFFSLVGCDNNGSLFSLTIALFSDLLGLI